MMAKTLGIFLCISSVAVGIDEIVSDDVKLEMILALETKIEWLQGKNQQAKMEFAKTKESSMSILNESARLAVEEERRLTVPTDALDHVWLIICGSLVMLMQAGFAMVESGSCRFKNVQNILMKNLVDVCMGTVCWWAVGFMFAYGFDENDKDDVFAGHLQYFGHEFGESDDNGNQSPTGQYLKWFFQWAFCATAATIVSGGVAERINMPCYLLYTIVMTSVIYPIVVAWMWSSNGWLAQPGKGVKKHLNQVGFNDFAGSGIVHLTGGVGALVGAIIVGPRKGRFDTSNENFNPHSLPLIVLGTFILWFGWYGFNCGSTLGMSSAGAGHLAAIVAMNTTLAASLGGLTVLLLRLIVTKTYDIGGMCNGILAGLVSITAPCANVDSGWAVFIGFVGGIVFVCASSLLKLLKIDDPIDAFAVHGACGIWGVLAAPIFDWGSGFDRYNGFMGLLSNVGNWDGDTKNLWKSGMAANLIEIAVIVTWVGGLSVVVFLPLRLIGLLRVPDYIQEKGMDSAKHSPSKAYTANADPEPKSPRVPAAPVPSAPATNAVEANPQAEDEI